MSKECIGYNEITNQFIYRDTGIKLKETKLEDTKVMIWGYELCNGAEWKDFLDVVKKLGKEKTDLEAKLADIEESARAVIEANFRIAEERDKLKQQLADMEQEQINEMKEHQETILEADKKIKELETKFAEKDNKLHEYIRCALEDYNDNQKEILELKQQLAEKEKEISNLRGLVNERDKQIKNLKTNKKRVIEHKNNVKISFAVEKLEKVKVLATNVFNESFGELCLSDVKEIIDQQIKAIKGE